MADDELRGNPNGWNGGDGLMDNDKTSQNGGGAPQGQQADPVDMDMTPSPGAIADAVRSAGTAGRDGGGAEGNEPEGQETEALEGDRDSAVRPASGADTLPGTIPAPATDDTGGLTLEPPESPSETPSPPQPPSQTVFDEKVGQAAADDGRHSPSVSEKEKEHLDNLAGLNDEVHEEKMKKRMGDRLVDMGLITRDQLGVALHEQQRTGKMLGSILVELGFIDDTALSTYLAESTGFEVFDPKAAMIDPSALERVPKKDAVQFEMLPLSYEDGNVIVAMADPYDVVALDRLRQCFPRGTTITPQLATPAVINDSIDNAYGYASSIDAILKELATGEAPDLTEVSADHAYSHPIVRLVNALVWDAVKVGASDLHFEPEENFVRLRYRIDGVLRTVQTLHKEYWSGIAQRLKIMAEMDIADKLNPQDGRFNLTLGAREADFRVSVLPTVHGENIVLRVLDKSTGIMPLEKLGFNEHNLGLISRSLKRPEGIIIVTGPTGSGKTTTMYSMLGAVNTVDVNIMTLEDPVEFPMPLMRQAQVKEGTGLSFADGVKALLRQDPDIIFIGEVRDLPTAEQALKAAMTGHQVFTTLHTNDCFGAIPRLTDLGLKPGMIAGAVIASFAQRLCRRLCTECKEAYTASPEECKLLGVDPEEPPTIYRAKGCDHCDNLGYKGRVAVAEILTFDDDIDEVVARGGHKHEIKDVARAKGFRSMADDAVEKVLAGLTSLEAATKVIDFTDRL